MTTEANKKVSQGRGQGYELSKAKRKWPTGKASSPNNQDVISGKGGDTQLPDFTKWE